MNSSLEYQEIHLQGIPISSGFALGKIQRVSSVNLDMLASFRHQASDVVAEIERFHQAIARSREIIEKLRDQKGKEIAEIFAAQLCILNDAAEVEAIDKKILDSNCNCECILAERILELQKKFETFDNEVFRARMLDIQDVFHRVLANLLDIDHVRNNPLKEVPAGTVIVSERLLPSDIIHINKDHISAIITEIGSTVSHAAILARSLKIPYVAEVKEATACMRTGYAVLINGGDGTVIIHPQPHTVKQYRNRSYTPHLAVRTDSQCRTHDGTPIRLYANASAPSDIISAYKNGAEGIGLFRTEFFYLTKAKQPSEEEEVKYYYDIFKQAAGKHLCLRLFDFGGDKAPVFMLPGNISGSSFGCRGLRYLLANESLLRRQVRCISSACTGEPFDILLPFVSLESEIIAAHSIIDDSFESGGIDKSLYRLGIMLEIPALFFRLDRILRHIDFVSVGTNDLTQYLFAADRENYAQREIMSEARVLVSELMQQAVAITSSQKKEISICGELAADPESIPLLLQAGVRALSVGPQSLLQVRSFIENIDIRVNRTP